MKKMSSMFVVYMAVLALWYSPAAMSDEEPSQALSTFPLAPADTSSPYATLSSFLSLTHKAGDLIETNLKLASKDTTKTSFDNERYIDTLMERAQHCFDLSKYALASQSRIGLESSLLLSEILKRTPDIDMSLVPGSPLWNKPTLPDRWRIPGTQIAIIKNSEGHYLFSSSSVENLRQYYQLVEHLPAKYDHTLDLYQFFESSPGTLIPPPWFYYLSVLPDSMFTLYGDQALWQWLFFILLTASFFCLLFLTGRYSRLLKLKVVGAAVIAASLKLYLWVLEAQINIGGQLMYQLTLISELVIWPLLAFSVYQACFKIMTTIASIGIKDSLKQSMVKVLSTIFSFVAAIMVVSYGATRVGIPVYGIVTSLSLGGMAIALAIRPTMENFIGGMVLYLDKAIQVGDYCEFEGISGTVESIGIRSTKIRALDRTMITIANGNLVRMKLTNYSRRDKFHLSTTLSVTYQTSMEDLNRVLESLTLYLENHPQVAQTPLRVNFTRFAACSLDIDIHAYVYALDRSEFLNTQQQVLFDIGEILSHHDVEFAYPTQTLHLQNSQ